MKVERKLERRACKEDLSILDPTTDQSIGFLIDITIEGIKLSAEKPFDLDSVYRFKMSLPKEIEGTDQLSFSALSKWCAINDCSPPCYEAGFQLRKISFRTIRILEYLIEEFCCDS